VTNAAPLLNVPRAPTDWDRWSFDLDQNIRDITQALRVQRGVNLGQQQIYPISTDTGQWLERVSGVIDDICGELGIPSADVETVNLEDERERQAWIWTIYQELNAARGMLKI
jgi:hypothetical protein